MRWVRASRVCAPGPSLLFHAQQVDHQFGIAFQKGDVLGGKGAIVEQRKGWQPKFVFRYTKIDGDNLTIGRPELVKEPLNKGSLVAFPPCQKGA